MSDGFTLHSGHLPLLVSMPHSGTRLARGMKGRMTKEGLALGDTDWLVPELYDFLDDLGATVLRAEYSRYVVDLNRPPDGAALYAGQSETGICPLTTFADQPIYKPGREPDAGESAIRIRRYWQPYHLCLGQTLETLVQKYGRVVLWDAHSIASRVPRFFAGKLPDLNLGTADGASCSREVADGVLEVMSRADFAVVRNGRFKGGHITRAYGAPRRHVHAMQMEIARGSYMDEATLNLDPGAADRLRPLLRTMLDTAVRLAR